MANGRMGFPLLGWMAAAPWFLVCYLSWGGTGCRLMTMSIILLINIILLSIILLDKY